ILLPVLALAVLSMLSRRASPPGARAGRLRGCPAAPNCVCSSAADAAHAVEPLRFTGPPAAAWERLVRAVRGMPRMTVVTADGGYLHATVTTTLFRFVDDLEFLLHEPGG